MRISLRLIVALAVAATLVSFLFAYYQVRAEKRSLRIDLERRAELLAESLQQSVEPLMGQNSRRSLQRLVSRFGNRAELAGVAVYGEKGELLAATPNLQPELRVPRPAIESAKKANQGVNEYFRQGPSLMEVYAVPLHREDQVIGALAVFHDATYIESQSKEIWRRTLLHVFVQMLVIIFVTVLVVRWSIVGPIARMAAWMRELRTGRAPPRPVMPSGDADLLRPLAQEVTHLARSLTAARASAQEEARLRESGESLWTAERLRIHLQSKLEENALYAISNREPYEHVFRGKEIVTMVPASGLVTALEPVLEACHGTWIAQGTGDADRETVDEHDRLRVPPQDPQYTLRRVWLTKEEEAGYYFGFANEGLWPLCHIAHNRPIFRAEDFHYYQQVNQKFAEAALEEMTEARQPLVLVQDYHFALLPRLIKQKRPDARVAIFWHIPWPNPEAFGICPWQRELLDGLLGADLIGFQIQSHCNNFLETVDRTLESRIDWERFAVSRRNHSTLVRPFPISVAFSENATRSSDGNPGWPDRSALFHDLGVEGAFLGIGVDRIDYTKGIPERFRGIERFLEKYPAYQGQFTFVQIAAPSRSHIRRYRELQSEIESEVDRINFKFRKGHWQPIILLKRHHSHREIEQFYRAAHLCMVTSLHDGMNLVAKEFVAARDDEQGVLILSRFTGAARELRDALIVNPYDTEQLADCIRTALEMDPEERRARMRRMREVVKDHNIYRWAASLITELADIRLEKPQAAKVARGFVC
jgi:trehalose-6-phosphate synthase/uncharacterized membrane protein affecting hemolysin expression